MDEIEIRIKAAEIALHYASRVTSAMIIANGISNITELSPLGIVDDVEKYIRTGEISKPIPATRKN